MENSWEYYTKIFMILVLIIVVVYDIIAISMVGPTASISKVLFKFSCANPIIPLGLGIVIGHVFWPLPN